MLRRILLIVGLLLLCTLAIQGCNPGMDYYACMQVQKLDGQPYLILQSVNNSGDGTNLDFSIYKPGVNGIGEWEPVATDRLGQALGIFHVNPVAVTVAPPTPTPAPTPAPAPTVPPVENPGTAPDEHKTPDVNRTPTPAPAPAPTTAPAAVAAAPHALLGIFHGDGGSTLFDLTATPVKSTFKKVPFTWTPLATAEFKGVQYTFGVDKFETDDKRTETPLHAARLDGDTWVDLNITGPVAKLNQLKVISLDAVALDDSIKVIWRAVTEDQSMVDYQRFTTSGPLNFASFNGSEFATEIKTVDKLPTGNASLWAENNAIHALIQTRPKVERALSSNGPMEIWEIQSDGGAAKLEEIEGSQVKPKLMSYIAAEHFTYKDNEYILRSNWQMFELWQRDAGKWKLIRTNPAGLPTYDLESMLVTALVFAAGMIAFGAFLAWRRRQAWTLMRRIQAHEIYATVGLRTGAYLVDLAIIVGMAMLFSHLRGVFANPIQMVAMDFTQPPYWPYFAIYMLYFSLCEWLLGTTAGKFLMGLCVVMDGGQKLSLTSAVIRNLVGFVERLPLIMPLIVWPMILLTPRRQRLGDMLSRSFVVHKGALKIFKQQREQELAKLRDESLAPTTVPPAKPDSELRDAAAKPKDGKNDR